jgi:hypothetical protein
MHEVDANGFHHRPKLEKSFAVVAITFTSPHHLLANTAKYATCLSVLFVFLSLCGKEVKALPKHNKLAGNKG